MVMTPVVVYQLYQDLYKLYRAEDQVPRCSKRQEIPVPTVKEHALKGSESVPNDCPDWDCVVVMVPS
jgi:hypothetical protein